jgi:hypothetical protein
MSRFEISAPKGDQNSYIDHGPQKASFSRSMIRFPFHLLPGSDRPFVHPPRSIWEVPGSDHPPTHVKDQRSSYGDRFRSLWMQVVGRTRGLRWMAVLLCAGGVVLIAYTIVTKLTEMMAVRYWNFIEDAYRHGFVRW